jgi:hypothetical protein
VHYVVSNTSAGTIDDPMPCTVWHVFAAFDTTRSGWVTAEQLGVGLRSLGVPTCKTRLHELCAETAVQNDSNVAGFGFVGFCRVLGVDDIDSELDRAARWVGRQAHIWDVVSAQLGGSRDSTAEWDAADATQSPLATLVEGPEEEDETDERDRGGGDRDGDGALAMRMPRATTTQQPVERRQYCEIVRSIAERRELTQGWLQALASRTAT